MVGLVLIFEIFVDISLLNFSQFVLLVFILGVVGTVIALLVILIIIGMWSEGVRGPGFREML